MFALLARREHSKKEIVHKLQNKGFEVEEIETLLAEFIDKNWQSDERFSESYARSRLMKGFGPIRIKMELKERGVETNLNTVFEETPNWQAVIEALHVKKYGNQPPRDMKERAKRTRFFQHKGFTHDMIKQLFNDMS